jgi:hypothetical protein
MSRTSSLNAPAYSTPVGPAPHHHEREQALPGGEIGRSGGLEPGEHVVPEIERGRKRAQGKGPRRDGVLPEEVDPGAGREHQIVERLRRAIRGVHHAGREVGPGHLREPDRHVLHAAEDGPDGVRDLARVQE